MCPTHYHLFTTPAILEWSTDILEWSGVVSGVFEKVAGVSKWLLNSGSIAATPAIADQCMGSTK